MHHKTGKRTIRIKDGMRRKGGLKPKVSLLMSSNKKKSDTLKKRHSKKE